MESLVVLVGLLLTAGIMVLPFVTLWIANAANQRARQLEIRLAVAEQRTESAERRANEIDQRLTAWIKYFSSAEISAPAEPVSAMPVADVSAPIADVSATPIADVSATPIADVSATGQRPTDPGKTAIPSQDLIGSPAPAGQPPRRSQSPAAIPPHAQLGAQSPSQRSKAPGFDWERLVGVRLFAWLGGGALFLAGALFLQFSIQRNLVSPEIRVAIGLLFGACALFAGDRLRVRTPFAGNALCGAGVAILYAALYAAHSLYELIDSTPAFGGMILVTVTAGLLAIRQNAYFVALLGLLGGMSTPTLLSTGADRPISLFGYVTALSFGVVYVSSRQGWPSLGLFGMLGASALFLGWSSRYLDAPRSAYALFATAIVAGIYALGRSPRPGPPRAGAALTLDTAAVCVPLIAALGIGVDHRLELSPLALSLHLVVVSGVTWFVSKRDALPLSPVAAGFSVVAWVLRMHPTLLRGSEPMVFACALIVPLAYFAAWQWHWRRDKKTPLTLALYIASVGAAPIVLSARTAYAYGSFVMPFSYAVLCALLLIAASLALRSGIALALAQLTLLASLAATGWTNHDSLNRATALALIGSGLCFFVLPLLHTRLRADAAAWLSAGLSLPLHFLLLYLCIRSEWGRPVLGMLALGSAALSLAMLAAVQRLQIVGRMPTRSLYALLAGGALAFITASLPILLSNEWLSVSWALEVLAVCWLYRRVKERRLLGFALLLATGVGARLLVNPAIWSYHARSATPLLNHYLYTFGVPIAALFTAAWLVQREEAARTLRLPAGFGFLATVLLFMLLNIEVADYFSTGDTLTFHWNGSGQLAQDMTYSLAWGAFGLGLLVAGLLLSKRAVRILSLLVLILTIGKVFLHDLWELGALYRVGSIVGLAVALLGVSYLTQRFILPKENT